MAHNSRREKIWDFLKKVVKLLLAKHYLRRNEPCEAIRCHFLENSQCISGIYSRNRTKHSIFHGILVKILLNQVENYKRNFVFSGGIVLPMRGVCEKLGQNSNTSQRVL